MELRKLWSHVTIPTGQTAEIVGIWQDRPGGDVNYLSRYESSGDRREKWFNEHELTDVAAVADGNTNESARPAGE
jgi:hypothetical protein